MIEEFQRRLHAVDENTLTPLVRTALHNESFIITDWQCTPLNKGAAQQFAGGYGLYRFQGNGRSEQSVEPQPWSLILKALGGKSGSGSDDMTQWAYWKREILAYQSGWLEKIPGGLCVPRCFAITEHPDDQY